LRDRDNAKRNFDAILDLTWIFLKLIRGDS
jgi:hypothetical protein